MAQKNSNYMQGLKSAILATLILATFQPGPGWFALLVRPLRIPRWTSKIIFVLGSYEFLAMLEGKIREAPFF